MHPTARALVERVAGDRESASAIVSYVLRDLEGMARKGLPVETWEELAVGLRRAKPSMAPMFNVSNAILLALEDGEDLLPIVEGLRREEEGSLGRIAALASGLKGRRMMTISYSGTVLAALRGMGAEEVVVAESLPMGEGRMFAQRLGAEGMVCEVIPDSMVFTMMEEVDGVLVGADAITPAGGVNKVGTLAMAVAAERSGKDLTVLAGWSKVCPVEVTDLERSVRLDEGLREIVQLYERFPLERATVVTDRGAMTHEALAREFSGWRMASALQGQNR